MRKISVKAYCFYRGEKCAVRVKAYTHDDEFCFHRDVFKPSHWRITHIYSGLNDGKSYKTREKALIAFCEPEWHEKCVNAGRKVVFDITQLPLKEKNERGEIIDVVGE